VTTRTIPDFGHLGPASSAGRRPPVAQRTRSPWLAMLSRCSSPQADEHPADAGFAWPLWSSVGFMPVATRHRTDLGRPPTGLWPARPSWPGWRGRPAHSPAPRAHAPFSGF